MTGRLAPVLSTHDFSPAEMRALVLDGEAYGLGACIVPIDEVESTSIRAASIRLDVPVGLTVELRSAAWMWGAWPSRPLRYELCSSLLARRRPAPTQALSLREVVIDEADVVGFDGLPVTTPVRTAIDLARSAADWTELHVRAVIELMRVGGFGASDCIALMAMRRNLPGRRVAVERLSGADAVDVVDRVDTPHGIQNPVEVRGVAHLEHEPAERQAVA